MAIPLDPYDPAALDVPVEPWGGTWPPDPSWDEPVPPEAPAPGPTPEDLAAQAQARAAADSLFQPEPDPAALQMGFPRVPADPPDADLIEIEPNEPDWSELEAEPPGPGAEVDLDAPPAPFDADLIEIEEPEAEPYAPTVEEAGTRLAEILSPEERAAKQYLRDQAAEAEALNKRIALANQEREAAEEQEKVRRTAAENTRREFEAINAEADRLAVEKVDPDGWSDSRSLFQVIAMFTAGIVGGLVQSRKGGANQGLAMIDQAIERHIDAQKANLAHRRDMLGRKRESLQERTAFEEASMRSEEAFRLGAYQRAIEQVETERQNFDPRGTQALKYAEFLQDLQARKAAAQQAFVDKEFDRQILIGKEMRAEEKHIADLAKTRAEAAKLQRVGGGGGGGASASKVKRTASEWNALYPGANVPDDGTPLTIAEYRQRGETGKSLTAPTELEKEARNLAVTGPRGQLKQKDGSFYNPPTDAAPKTRQLMYTTGQIIADLDRALYLRDSVGGELDQLNSNERQEYDQIEQRVTLMAKGQHEGMSSDSDLKRLGTSLGVENLASFRSKAHGLKTAREAVVRQVNGWLNANNYTGDPVTWPNTQTKSTKRTAKEKLAQDLIKSNAGNDPSRLPTVAAAAGPIGYSAKAVDWGVGKVEGKTKATPDEDKTMRAFIRGAQGGDAASIQALRDIADGSNSEAFRNQAKAALMVIDFMQRTPDEEESAKDREEAEAFLKGGE